MVTMRPRRAAVFAIAFFLFVGLSTLMGPIEISAQDGATPKQSSPDKDAGDALDELDKLIGADESDQKAIEVIESYLSAVGGRETLASIKDRIERFDNKKLTPTGETVMKMSRYLARPVMIREEWELPGMGSTKGNEPLSFTQVYNGEEAWVKAMGFVSALSGKTLTVFVWDKHIDDFFMTWKENGWTAKYVGEAEASGKPVQVIDLLSFAGNQRVRYSFSKEDGLLVSKTWTEGQPPARMRKEVFFDDYLKIRFRDNPEKWVRHATTQRIFENGELTLEKLYTEIVLNGGLPASTFGRPDGPDYDPAEIAKRQGQNAGETPASKPAEKEEKKKPVWETPKKPSPKKPTSQPKGG